MHRGCSGGAPGLALRTGSWEGRRLVPTRGAGAERRPQEAQWAEGCPQPWERHSSAPPSSTDQEVPRVEQPCALSRSVHGAPPGARTRAGFPSGSPSSGAATTVSPGRDLRV